MWDTDLPSSFEVKGFVDDADHGSNDGEIWFKASQASEGYPVKTKVPAKTTVGKFPKHYSLDCEDIYIGDNMRDDGDGGVLECKLATTNSADDDGANPNALSVRFYHVCGASECEQKKWAVYPPVGESCVNVRCEHPSDICCNDPKGDCGGVSHQQCQKDQWPHECDHPPCGKNTSGWHGCPPFGLYACSYGNWNCNNALDSHHHSISGIDCGCANPSGCGPGYHASENSYGVTICQHNRENTTKSFKYWCSASQSWSCGTSNSPRPCPYWPQTHSCGGSPDCLQEVTVTENGKTSSVCVEWEDPYPLQCSVGGVGGTCVRPSGGCGPKGPGGGNKNLEKSTPRDGASCGSTCTGTCCPGDAGYPNCPTLSCTGDNEYVDQATCQSGIDQDRQRCREKQNKCWERYPIGCLLCKSGNVNIGDATTCDGQNEGDTCGGSGICTLSSNCSPGGGI